MEAKEILANYVLQYLKENDIIGLGTGRTIRKLIEVLSKEEGIKRGSIFLASSIDSELELSKNGFKVISLFSGLRPSIYIDSFDVLTNTGVMIKGGGGALFREKLLTYFSKYKIFIGEESKFKKNVKALEVPIEVVNVSVNYVMRELENIGYEVKYREGSGKIGPIISDNGNIILDVIVKTEELCEFDKNVKKIPGVIETGVFCKELYNKIILADNNGRIEEIEPNK
ncbi:MAG: ribose 5-phosphate isomerase A [Saccharolobus sp.]|uniref:ribose 5-phosphate isomerase A n=1 Tax=Saccharolobus sp. TaxID=2100761 RepID=UPI0028CDE637|nr:ribose 5-phosphate isomerase A [Saccharolobus sp.]MDT7861063.1 ribose 5-phosphate isomerase A [Saccharolobus sp.]